MEEDKNEFLDRYLAGEPMTGEQKKQVEQWLRHDSDLRNRADLLIHMHDWGRYQRQTAWTNRPQVRLLARPFAWAAAASMALIAGIGVWWYNQASDIRPVAGNQTIIQKVPVYENRDLQLGFAKSGHPADSTFLMQNQIRIGQSPEYWFASYDTLQVRMSAKMATQQWYIVRVNEVDYQLASDSVAYPLQLGRHLWLPLIPKQ